MAALKRNCILCTLCFLLLFGGCGNYQELNEFDIVAGMAVDSTADGYKVTLELVNQEGFLQDGLSSRTVTLEGKTFPKALESSNVRFSKQFHYGNMQVIIISEEIARQEGIGELLNCFLRDYSIRETIQLLVSIGESAEETLSANGVDNTIVSYALEEIVRPPRLANSHTKEISIYNALDTLKTPGKTLVLPCVQTWVDEEENPCIEVSGLAAFSEDRLQLLLPQQDTPFFLYAMNQLQTHELAFLLPDSQKEITVRITKSETKRSFSESENTIRFRFDITASGSLSHTPPGMDIMDPAEKKHLEQAASGTLRNAVSGLLTSSLQEYGLDIASMQYDIYLWNQTLWKKAEHGIQNNSVDIAIDVNAQVEITSAGNIRNT